MSNAYQWRTAHKHYRCADDGMWAHRSDIRPGDRYLYLTVFPGDMFDRIRNLRYCAVCAISYEMVRPDPQRRRRDG